MVREKVSFRDFHRIAKENEFFLWHFVQKEQEKNGLSVCSILHGSKPKNPLEYILEGLDIPYYESYTEEGIDFLMGLGYPYNILYNSTIVKDIIVPNNFRFSPVFIGFKKFSKVASTLDRCYCVEGIIEIINLLNPDFMEQILINLEKNPD